VHVPLGAGAGSLVIDFESQPGRADSGELDGDLNALFTEVGEPRKTAAPASYSPSTRSNTWVVRSSRPSSSGYTGCPS